MLAQLFTAQSVIHWTQPNASLVQLEQSSTTSPSLALARTDTSSMEPLVSNALTNAKTAAHPTEHALPALTLSAETATKIVNALLDSMILDQLTVLPAHPLAYHAQTELAAHHAMPLSSETSQAAFAHASMDTMSFTTLINRAPVENALLNVLHAQLHPLHAHHAILIRIDSLESMLQDVKLVFVNLDTTPLLMDHVFNLTVILIPSALNASKDLDFVSNVWPQGTESLSIQKPFVFVWMDSMLMLTIPVFHALVDACSALQLLTAQAVLFWPPLMELELEPAHAPQRPTLLSHLMVFAIVLLVDLTAAFASMPIPAQLAFPLSPRQSTTNASVQ
jgi:hypothetical protein